MTGIDRKKRKNRALKMRDFILDLILPINCVGCGQEGFWICKNCYIDLIKNDITKKCFSCGKQIKAGSLCQLCSPLFCFDSLYIAGNYQNQILSELIKIYKYRFARKLSLVLADYIYDRLMLLPPTSKQSFSLYPDLSKFLFIPVPLHRKRQQWRGFNQAELIARELINKTSGELVKNYLRRIKFHLPQTRLKKEQRKKNIKNAFVWQGPKLHDRKIILLDDIITTGATLNECARILKENGANEIICLVVAHGI